MKSFCSYYHIFIQHIYIHKRILNLGFETEIISGITSFCAAAAKINEGLVESDLVLVENVAYKNYFSGADLNRFIEDQNITPKVLKTVKNLCRTLLEPLLQNKTIQSREIYKSFIDNKITIKVCFFMLFFT